MLRSWTQGHQHRAGSLDGLYPLNMVELVKKKSICILVCESYLCLSKFMEKGQCPKN